MGRKQFSSRVILEQTAEIDGTAVLPVSVQKDKIVQQLNETHAVGGVLTFADDMEKVQILNRDTVNDGVFTVNGIAITVPPEMFFQCVLSNAFSSEVTVSGSTSYLVTRLT